MTFDKIISTPNCDCFENTFKDHQTSFALKINRGFLRDGDFKTHWEKGLQEYDNCDSACSLKSKSISILRTDYDLTETLKVFKELFLVSPKYKPYFAVIRFKEESGRIKLTPSAHNKRHCDLYKSDLFNKEMVDLIKTIPLEDV
jgi:hypothetical protein